jgi:hypothetical protein
MTKLLTALTVATILAAMAADCRGTDSRPCTISLEATADAT